MNRWSRLLKNRLPQYRWFQRTYGKQHRADHTKSSLKSGFPHRNTQYFVKRTAARRAKNKVARRSRARNRLR